MDRETDERTESARTTTVRESQWQFSVAALLVLQIFAAIAALIGKSLGAAFLVSGLLVVMALAGCVAGCIWVVKNFQRMNELIRTYWVLYIGAAIVTYVLLAWFA